MFKITVILLAALIVSANVFSQNKEKEIKMKNQLDSVSYIIGYDLGQNFKAQSIEINPEILLAAIIEGMKQGKQLISNQESEKVLAAYVEEIQKKKQSQQSETIKKTKQEGEAFLLANKTKAGVVTTNSGLQYKIIREGTGASPKSTDKVVVHYAGRLVNGTKFDASYDRGNPAEFPVNGVILGWQEGLQLMKEGGKYELYIPADLGYGDNGAGESIPGGAVLIFEVELIKVIPQ